MFAKRMRLFWVQQRFEFHRLWRRPHGKLLLLAIPLAEVILSLLLRIPAVRTLIAKDMWKMQWSFQETFSGLMTATHMLGEIVSTLGALGLALIGAGLFANENEEGTLRSIFSRPVTRAAVFVQKLIAAIVCTVFVVMYSGITALMCGLLFEGRGPLVFVATHEGVLGAFDFHAGLQRYGWALGLFCLSALSGTLVAFAFGCMKIKPASAAVCALTILFADTIVRTQVGMGSVAPYCITTRLLSWRQVFNDEIPWGAHPQ